MKTYFFDTSAFLKRYIKETGSDAVDAMFGEEAIRYISAVCLLECFSNFQRLCAVDGLLNANDLKRLLATVSLEIDSGTVTTINATSADIDTALEILAGQYLTAIDALQIAIAGRLGPDTVLVSSDTKLNRVASEQGLTVADPNLEASPGRAR